MADTEQRNDDMTPRFHNAMVQIPFPDTFTYANCAAFGFSLMDMHIGFGELMSDGKVSSKAGIVLPIEAAALVAVMLVRQITDYERVFGDVRHPLWQQTREKLALAVSDPSVSDPSIAKVE